MRLFINWLLAILLISLMAIASLLFSTLAIIGGTIVSLIPRQSWRQKPLQVVETIPSLWTSFNNLCVRMRPCTWDIQGNAALSNKQWYVLIANHQSWLDILVLGYVFNWKIPLLKFFMKKELLWILPIVGMACWMLDYPIMHRHSKEAIRKRPELKMKDIETTKKSCQKFLEVPTTVVNFVEGARYFKDKHRQQDAPFKYLLRPKAAGTAIVINELQHYLSGILNVTIHYSDAGISFWKFFRQGCPKISVRYELLPITPDLIGDYYTDRKLRVHFQSWLNQLWRKKDLLLDELNRLP